MKNSSKLEMANPFLTLMSNISHSGLDIGSCEPSPVVICGPTVVLVPLAAFFTNI